jgi:hypothetical protein
VKYAVEMGSDAMIYEYIPNLIKICSGFQKLMEGGGGGGFTETKTAR